MVQLLRRLLAPTRVLLGGRCSAAMRMSCTISYHVISQLPCYVSMRSLMRLQLATLHELYRMTRISIPTIFLSRFRVQPEVALAIHLSPLSYYSDTECREGTNGRALTTGMGVAGGASAMTVALCTSTCGAAGFSLSGVEYARECCKIP